MTDEQRDHLHEAFHAAVYHLVSDAGGLRERLRAAVAELEKCQALGGATPPDPHDAAAVKALPGLLADGRKVAGLSGTQCEDLAWGVWAAQRDVDDALTRRADAQHNGTLNDP
jgi:hypothetical protein